MNVYNLYKRELKQLTSDMGAQKFLKANFKKELSLDANLELSFIEKLIKKIYDAEKSSHGSQKILDSEDKSNKSKEQIQYVELYEKMIDTS